MKLFRMKKLRISKIAEDGIATYNDLISRKKKVFAFMQN